MRYCMDKLKKSALSFANLMKYVHELVAGSKKHC